MLLACDSCKIVIFQLHHISIFISCHCTVRKSSFSFSFLSSIFPFFPFFLLTHKCFKLSFSAQVIVAAFSLAPDPLEMPQLFYDYVLNFWYNEILQALFVISLPKL